MVWFLLLLLLFSVLQSTLEAKAIFTISSTLSNITFPTVYQTFGMREQWKRVENPEGVLIPFIVTEKCEFYPSVEKGVNEKWIAIARGDDFVDYGCTFHQLYIQLMNEGYSGVLFSVPYKFQMV